MRTKYILIGILWTILLTENVVAESPYGKIYTYDAYFNDKLLSSTDAEKPVLKIGEPFTVGINITVYQKSEVSVQLNEIGEGYFVIIEGTTSKMNVYRADVMEKNSSILYKWTVTPTEKWADGSIPINIIYQINDFKTGKILVNSEFTVAYPYISNEYYEKKDPISEKESVQKTQSTPEPQSIPKSAPAFSFVTAIVTFIILFSRLSRH
jgi:MAST domain-containing protein